MVGSAGSPRPGAATTYNQAKHFAVAQDAHRANDTVCAYVAGTFDLPGPVDRDALDSAMLHFVRRHEVLRCSFQQFVGEVSCDVLGPDDVELPVHADRRARHRRGLRSVRERPHPRPPGDRQLRRLQPRAAPSERLPGRRRRPAGLLAGLPDVPGFPYGAAHGFELPYLFVSPLTKQPLTDRQRALANRMADYWTRFAHTGNPNHPGAPLWPAFRTRTPLAQSLAPGRHGVEPLDVGQAHHGPFWARHRG
ncbi:carboxylesterase family protein [Streptomyces roseifaciens]